ncbi:hypothetical protein GW7_09909 [Heterocephalus glaber]|uniref:Uncharacterized protein n=1 Tax=Heterocephalus glaber TaxID=10181 RepID=G5ANU2_HETGA|nr:hypothetical protein GW7_09909 [Heterocephalus glaber]
MINTGALGASDEIIRWDKNPVFFKLPFSPSTDLATAGTDSPQGGHVPEKPGLPSARNFLKSGGGPAVIKRKAENAGIL